MHQVNNYFTIYALTIIFWIAVIDIRSHRIPNVLLLVGIICAVTFHGWMQGVNGIIFSLTGLLAGTGLLIVPFIFGWMGAGDAKFLGLIGSVWGWPSVFEIFVLATLVGGGLALVVLIANPVIFKRLLKKFQHLFVNVTTLIKQSAVMAVGSGNIDTKDIPIKDAEESCDGLKSWISVPYGAAIALGTAIWLTFDLSGYHFNLI